MYCGCPLPGKKTLMSSPSMRFITNGPMPPANAGRRRSSYGGRGSLKGGRLTTRIITLPFWLRCHCTIASLQTVLVAGNVVDANGAGRCGIGGSVCVAGSSISTIPTSSISATSTSCGNTRLRITAGGRTSAFSSHSSRLVINIHLRSTSNSHQYVPSVLYIIHKISLKPTIVHSRSSLT